MPKLPWEMKGQVATDTAFIKDLALFHGNCLFLRTGGSYIGMAVASI